MFQRFRQAPLADPRITSALVPARVGIAGPGGGYGGAGLFWLPDQPPTSRVGYGGAPQTIDVMNKAALGDASDFSTRQLAEIVCEGLDSKDYVSEYIALLNFLLQRTRYMRDPRRTELVRAPDLISRQILSGHRPSLDCDDMATWLAAAVLAIGGTPQFATVAFSNLWYDDGAGHRERQYSHVFCVALEPRTRTRIVLDPVAAEKTKEMIGRVRAARLWAPLA